MHRSRRSCASAPDRTSLRTAWRTERQTEDRAAGIPAIGTPEWHAQFTDTPPADTEQPTDDAGSVQQAEALS